MTSVILSKKILCSGHKTPFTFKLPYEVSSCRREQEVSVHSASSSIHTQLSGQAYVLQSKEIAVITNKTMIDMNSSFLVLTDARITSITTNMRIIARITSITRIMSITDQGLQGLRGFMRIMDQGLQDYEGYEDYGSRDYEDYMLVILVILGHVTYWRPS